MSKHLTKACPPKKALSTDDVETIYGMPKGTQANLRSRREGPVFWKVGGKVYYEPISFDLWFFSHKVITKGAVDTSQRR